MRYVCVLCKQQQASSRIRRHEVLGRSVCHTCFSKHDNPASLGSAVQQAILEGKHVHTSSDRRQRLPAIPAGFIHESSEAITSIEIPNRPNGYRPK